MRGLQGSKSSSDGKCSRHCKKNSKIANTNMDKAVRNKKEQKDFEIEEFIKVAQKRLDYEEEMLKEMEDEMQVEMREEFDDDFYTE